MDLAARFLSGIVIEYSNMDAAIYAFEAPWIAEFLFLIERQRDKALVTKKFFKYLKGHDINFRPVSHGQHSRNMIGSKHEIIFSIFLCHKGAESDSTEGRHNAICALTIYNDLFVNDILSAFEMSRGFTKPASYETS